MDARGELSRRDTTVVTRVHSLLARAQGQLLGFDRPAPIPASHRTPRPCSRRPDSIDSARRELARRKSPRGCKQPRGNLHQYG
ncbi:hypothetical protein ASD86_10450 [Lysobacter sp. Root690]|nr:hypothetical protein ASD86_10450 [Lysobacter sp. Root690]